MKNNSITYKGDLREYQMLGANAHPSKKHMRMPQQYKFNRYQNFLYNRALKGLHAYEPAERKYMHHQKKKRIKHTHKRAQSCLNIFKQEVVNEMCDNILNAFCEQSNVGYLLSSEDVGEDPEFVNTLELKSLGISKTMVIKRFVKEGILPSDFYQLKNP